MNRKRWQMESIRLWGENELKQHFLPTRYYFFFFLTLGRNVLFYSVKMYKKQQRLNKRHPNAKRTVSQHNLAWIWKTETLFVELGKLWSQTSEFLQPIKHCSVIHTLYVQFSLHCQKATEPIRTLIYLRENECKGCVLVPKPENWRQKHLYWWVLWVVVKWSLLVFTKLICLSSPLSLWITTVT